LCVGGGFFFCFLFVRGGVAFSAPDPTDRIKGSPIQKEEEEKVERLYRPSIHSTGEGKKKKAMLQEPKRGESPAVLPQSEEGSRLPKFKGEGRKRYTGDDPALSPLCAIAYQLLQEKGRKGHLTKEKEKRKRRKGVLSYSSFIGSERRKKKRSTSRYLEIKKRKKERPAISTLLSPPS